ncbi:hypothetical protein DFJ74DRAFT_671942 [Hyaloraphidium curvatum]|nr:hypothetical protein DFJ74DRAFT_671942 [Hyaloraphidium curvatum]
MSAAAQSAKKQVAPVPPQEQAVAKQLVDIRHRLNELKRSHSYVMKDVENASQEVGEALSTLREIRESSFADSGLERNSLDDVLDDIWLVLFQLWAGCATVDKAIYPFFTQLVGIKRQLGAMRSSGAFLVEDVTALQEQMTKIEEQHVVDGKFFESKKKAQQDPGNPAPGQAVLFTLLNQNRRTAHLLLEESENLDSALEPVLAELVAVSKEAQRLKARGSYSAVDVETLKQRVDLVDSKRVNGVFVVEGEAGIAGGQARLVGILEGVQDTLTDMLATKEEVSGPLRPLFEELMEISDKLEELYTTKRWTVTSGDLVTYRERLNTIDTMRSPDGAFKAEDGTIPPGQAAVNTLLAQCYHIQQKLLEPTEGLDISLEPVYAELGHCRLALLALRRKGRDGKHIGAMELVDIQEKLRAINQVEGGKIVPADWKTGDPVPEGQAVLSALLNECYALVDLVRPYAKG